MTSYGPDSGGKLHGMGGLRVFETHRLKKGLSGWHQWQRTCLPVEETQETLVQSWVRKVPWKRKWQPIPVFLPGKPHALDKLQPVALQGVGHD